MAGPWEKYSAAETPSQEGPWAKYGAEGMPQERKPLTMGESFMQLPIGVYKGFKDVTDTLIKGGASALDYVAGTDTRKAVDEAAARQAEEYARTYGGSDLAAGGRLIGNVAATLPVGGVMAAPFKGIAPEVAAALQSGGFGAKTLVGRGAAGAATGAASAGLINPDDAETGAIVGAVIPTVAAPVVKGISTIAAKTSDLLSGNTAKVKAAQIARESLGDNLHPALNALANADPVRKLTPSQILQEAGINPEPFMALESFAKARDIKGAYSNLEKLTEQRQLNELAQLTGGRTQTETGESLLANKNALNAQTGPMRDVELNAANQANQTRQRLEPYLAQKQDSMVDALQGQGRAATDAAQATARAETGAPGFLTQGTRAAESGALADTMAAIKTQRQAERDLVQTQIGSLEAHGLKPINIDPIISVIDSKIADPNLYGQSQLLNVLNSLRDEFAGAVAANGGVADARALYSMRKAGISQKIDDMYGSLDPSSKQKLTADVLASIKTPIDKAITEAGGTGWNRYLQTFETGMHGIDQQRLAQIALDRFKGDKTGFLKLVNGDDRAAVEKVFGAGSFNIFKEMGRNSAVLQNIGKELERDISIKASANAGRLGLSDIMTKDQSTLRRIANIVGRGGRATELTLEQLEGKVNKKVIDSFREGFKSGKDALEMLSALPKEESNAIIKALRNTKKWDASVTRGAAQLNTLAPENRNNLRP